jgi:hypothetical protein
MVKTLYFLAIMLTAIAMGAGLAHFFELPNKIDIGAADYLTVQRNYDNWWIVGLSVPLAFLSVLALCVKLRGTGTAFTLALIAFLLLEPRHRKLDDAAWQLGGAALNIHTRREPLSMCWQWERS